MTQSATYPILMPPSLNGAFMNSGTGGRHKSPRYVQWCEEAGWRLRANGPIRKVAGSVSVSLRFARSETQADLDNLIKPVLDLMVTMGAMDDDRNVRAVRAEFVDGTESTITIEALP